jgi:hypothetical protein
VRTPVLIASAIVSFAIGSASIASSSIENLPGYGLTGIWAGERDIPLPGGTWASTGVEVVYVDGNSPQSGKMGLDLIRFSYTGTRTETVQAASYNAGQFEAAMWTPNMSTNASPWDYYTLILYAESGPNFSTISMTGVAASSN